MYKGRKKNLNELGLHFLPSQIPPPPGKISVKNAMFHSGFDRYTITYDISTQDILSTWNSGLSLGLWKILQQQFISSTVIGTAMFEVLLKATILAAAEWRHERL